MACSAADTMLDCGAFTTMTPRSVAWGTSTLSRPMPARPTTTRSRAASSVAASTWVAERMMSAWAPSMAVSSSSGDSPRRTSTSWPALRSSCSPDAAISSVTSMRATMLLLSRVDTRLRGAQCPSTRAARRSSPSTMASSLSA